MSRTHKLRSCKAAPARFILTNLDFRKRSSLILA